MATMLFSTSQTPCIQFVVKIIKQLENHRHFSTSLHAIFMQLIQWYNHSRWRTKAEISNDNERSWSGGSQRIPKNQSWRETRLRDKEARQQQQIREETNFRNSGSFDLRSKSGKNPGRWSYLGNQNIENPPRLGDSGWISPITIFAAQLETRIDSWC